MCVWKKNIVKLTLGRTHKFIAPPLYNLEEEGGAMDGTPPRSFWYMYVAVFWNDFTSSGKPLIFLTR